MSADKYPSIFLHQMATIVYMYFITIGFFFIPIVTSGEVTFHCFHLLNISQYLSVSHNTVPEKISCRALVTSSSLHCSGAQIPQRIGNDWIVKESKVNKKSETQHFYFLTLSPSLNIHN